MSTISGISGMMGSMSVQGMQGRPDPAEKFKEQDADSSGGLDKTELSTMAKELSKMTGKTLNVDDSITTYDDDNDGQLSQDEMDTMMQKTMGPPTSSGAGMQQVMEAYKSNSGDDEISTLMKMLENLDNTASSSSTSTSRPDPEAKFKELDGDGNGGLNKSELDVMAKDIASMTGQTMDTEEALNKYDTDKDGELSKTEMDIMLKETMAKSGGSQQASTTDDQVSLLRQLMEQYATNFSIESDKDVKSIS